MQITSDVYKDLLARGAAKEVRVEIGGEIYGEDRLVEVTTSGGLFSSDTLCVGSAVSKQIDLSVVDYGNIPRMAKIIPSYRLVLGEEVSEWVQKGVFYIDTRQPDKTSGVLTIHGFDAMLKSSVIWVPDQSLVFPMTRRAAAIAISNSMGVVLDNPDDIDDTQLVVDYPANDYTQRDVLRFIAASHASNFVITDLGKLRMVPINSLAEETGYLVNEIGKTILIGGIAIRVSDVDENNITGSGDKVFVGPNVSSSGASPAFDPVSKIVLKVDSENAFVSGDDSGTTIEADCPYATQDMADDLIQKVRGFVYRPFTADDAIVDPAIELGDGITVDGVYTMLIRQDIQFDGLMTSRIASPGAYEVESEYPYQTREMQLDYKIAETRSSIAKTAEQIRLEVFGEDGYSGSSITAQLGEISAEVNGKINGEDASALIQAALEAIELSISNSEGTTTFTLTGGGVELDTEIFDLHVKAVNIDGTLSASQINTEELNAGVTSIVNGVVTTEYVNALGVTAGSVSASNVTAGTLSAGGIALDGLLAAKYGQATYGYLGANATEGGVVIADSSANVFCIASSNAAKISYYEQKMIWVASDGCFSSDTMQQLSDKTLKHSINYDLDIEAELFRKLRPCSFIYNNDTSGKKHWGFIAQELLASAEEVGMDADKLAVLSQFEGKYTIGYGEITALNTLMIQKLVERVEALENKLGG